MLSYDHVRRGGMLSTSSAPLTFDAIYPVGSIITTTDPYFNPNNASGWSGTWERLNRKCFLYQNVEHPGQYSGSYEKTYNCSSTTLTTSQIPSHTHDLNLDCNSAGSHTHTTTNIITSNNGLHHHSVTGDTESVQGHYHTIDLYTVGYPDDSSCHSHLVVNRGYDTVSQGSGAQSMFVTKNDDASSNWERRWTTPGFDWLDDHNIWSLTDKQIYDATGGHQHRVTGNTSFMEGHDHSIDLDTSNAGDHNHIIPPALTTESGSHTHNISGEASSTGGNQSHNHNVTLHVDDFEHYNCIFWVRTA